ncbi:TonB-dependent receptor [Sphingomonas sp. R-74633]|uniref:TonB-dependent receptor n=1 Tax=Sphingomonas sp. R-74633 TaxID=2751188 RepID=UPI0015D1CE62|nr:TonB-dependent receptor [Sphingomonas sp. R-74633]NYT41814.1 TonB-dependent receptor [Sphingomonas sp. R-74633]
MTRAHTYLLASAAIVCGAVPSAHAMAQVRRFDVAAQPASSGIPMFARQAGIEILAPASIVDGISTNRVQGTMDVTAALRVLLAGTDLVPVVNGTSVILKRRVADRNIAYSQTAPAQSVPATPDSGAQTDAADPTQEIVVSGIRRSLETAQAVKQEADQIVDSVVAEDVGKLPDVTAAESLARITGVQVTRAEGEASGTRVRGLPDVTTTYNGRDIFTGQGRSVALQDFPASSIGRIDVYKSGSANLQEAGIAGLVDVKSRKPFDFKGTRIVAGVGGVHWRQSQKLAADFNLLVSSRWQTGIGEMGLLVEGSLTNNNFLDSARNVSQSILNRTGVAGTTGAIRYPSFINIVYTTGNRWRPSASAAFQWRPASNLEIYADGLFQGYRAENENRNLTINSGPAAVLSNVTYFPGTNMVQSMTATGGAFPNGAQNAIDGRTDTYQVGGGFIWKPGRLKVTGDLALTDSTYTQRVFAFNYALQSAPSRNFNFDTPAGAGGGTVTLNNFDLFAPTSFRMTGISETGQRNHGRDVQAKLDVEAPVNLLGLDRIQAGVRYNNRDLDARNVSRSGTAIAAQLFTVLPLEYDAAPAGFAGDNVDTIHSWLTPTRDSILAQADTLRTLSNVAKGAPAFGDPVYVGNEKGYAAYLQGHYSFNIGVPVDGLIGLRAVRTEDMISGVQRVTTGGVTTIAPITKNNSYEDYLPNVSARVKFARNLQLRLAYTKTRTRPSFDNLNPSITIGATTTCSADATLQCSPASSGNPNLQPVRSSNYDASLEYYFTRSGAITVGAFHRDLTGFINTTSSVVNDPQYGRLEISRPENGGKGRISGVEAGFRTFLRAPWLPSFLSNFGVLANYTYIDHKSELSPTLAKTLPGMQPLSGVSNHLVNGSVFYENKVFSARVSYNYRSDFIVSYDQVADPGLPGSALSPTLPTTEKGRGSLDLSSTLSPTEAVTLSFNVTNLLGQAASNSRVFNAQGQAYPWQTRFLETVYRLGVRVRF